MTKRICLSEGSDRERFPADNGDRGPRSRRSGPNLRIFSELGGIMQRTLKVFGTIVLGVVVSAPGLRGEDVTTTDLRSAARGSFDLSQLTELSAATIGQADPMSGWWLGGSLDLGYTVNFDSPRSAVTPRANRTLCYSAFREAGQAILRPLLSRLRRMMRSRLTKTQPSSVKTCSRTTAQASTAIRISTR